MTGAVLLVLFVAECLTLLNIGNLLTLHVFLGMLLLGPVGLKIGSTLWRFTRYYAGSAAYVRRGPPAPLQRVTGPFVILTTVAVLGTGIMLAVEGPGNGSWAGCTTCRSFSGRSLSSSTWPRTSRGCPGSCRAGRMTPATCSRPGPRAGSCCAVPSPPAWGWRSPPITSRPSSAARTASSRKPGAWPGPPCCLCLSRSWDRLPPRADNPPGSPAASLRRFRHDIIAKPQVPGCSPGKQNQDQLPERVMCVRVA